jgi:hypothetical protein
MPKINGKNIDPKVYAKRVTQAKKVIGNMDPELKAKIAQMYPKVTKEQIAKKQLSPKKATPKVNMKVTPKPTAKPKATKKPLTKSEQDFISGQKLKAKITKKTGVYPNTAN